MRITRKEKILLALMLGGSLAVAGTAQAADDDPIEITTNLIDPSNVTTDTTTGEVTLGNPLGTVTTTVTVNAPEVTDTETSTETKTGYTHTYPDPDTTTGTSTGNSYTITYTPAGTEVTDGDTTTTTETDSYTLTVTTTTTDETTGDETTTSKSYTYTASGTEEGTDGNTYATAATFTYSTTDTDGATTSKSYTYIPGATVSLDTTTTVSGSDATTGISGLTYGTQDGSTGTAVYYWGTDTNGNTTLTTNGTGTAAVTIYTSTGDYQTQSATNNGGNGNAALVINSVTSSSTGDVSQSINANFIGNTATPSSQGVVAVVVNLNTSAATTDATNYTASITSINGNFIGNVNTSDNDDHTSANGGAILNQVGMETPSTIGGAATIGSITGSFIGNGAVNTVSYEVEEGGSITTTEVTTAQQGPEYMARGGAIENNLYNPYDADSSASIGTITGDFIGNYATTTWGDAQGGAIFNYASIHTEDASESELAASASIGNINGNFISNYVSGASYANGGAIYSTSDGYCIAIIGNINGDFIGNYAYSSETEASGGAIFNVSENSGTAVVGALTGSFIGNYAECDTGEALGGAIFNTTQSGQTIIGATYVDDGSGTYTLTNAEYAITGDFIGNYASGTSAGGGAISNWVDTETTQVVEGVEEAAIIGDIMASTEYGYGFMYNYAVGTDGEAGGGAIENRSEGAGGTAQIGNITADFIGNYASATNGNAYGGAIQNRADYEEGTETTGNTAVIGDITGNFIGNYAIATLDENATANTTASAYGGAINNFLIANSPSLAADMGVITGNFIDNYVSATNDARGGAISNGYNQTSVGDSTIDGIFNSTFIGNTATSTGTGDDDSSYGGAIFTTGTIGRGYTYDYTYDSDNNITGINGVIVDSTESATGADIAGIYNSIFIANNADRGGAIYNGSEKASVEDDNEGASESYSIITSIESSVFEGNIANLYGGAIYNYNDGQIYSIANSQFLDNEAQSGNGGAIERRVGLQYHLEHHGRLFLRKQSHRSHRKHHDRLGRRDLQRRTHRYVCRDRHVYRR